MDADKLKGVLEKHAKWLNNEEGGERADLTGADLTGADLSEANIDLSCWPLWCGSKSVKVDAQIARQLAAHFCVLDCDNAEYQAARAAILEFARKSHRASDLGLVNGDTDK
jgi:hypothetical protein